MNRQEAIEQFKDLAWYYGSLTRALYIHGLEYKLSYRLTAADGDEPMAIIIYNGVEWKTYILNSCRFEDNIIYEETNKTFKDAYHSLREICGREWEPHEEYDGSELI